LPLAWVFSQVNTFFRGSFDQKEKEAQERAAEILRNAESAAENIKKDRILEAKEKYLRLKSEFEDDANKKRVILQTNEQKLKQREQSLNQTIEQNKRRENELETLKTNLNQQVELASKRREEAEKSLQQQVTQLEKIANLTADQAREQLIDALKAEADTRAGSYVKSAMEEARLTATKEAKKIVIETIQRTAAEHAIENCVSVFNIENDDIKGKIIGREGRNIRALEAATGLRLSSMIPRKPS
jgi:ribonuclease Y